MQGWREWCDVCEEEPTAKRYSMKKQYFVCERRKMSCGVPGHQKGAEREGDRSWREANQHQGINKGTQKGDPGLELSPDHGLGAAERRGMLSSEARSWEPGGVRRSCLH